MRLPTSVNLMPMLFERSMTHRSGLRHLGAVTVCDTVCMCYNDMLTAVPPGIQEFLCFSPMT